MFIQEREGKNAKDKKSGSTICFYYSASMGVGICFYKKVSGGIGLLRKTVIDLVTHFRNGIGKRVRIITSGGDHPYLCTLCYKLRSSGIKNRAATDE